MSDSELENYLKLAKKKLRLERVEREMEKQVEVPTPKQDKPLPLNQEISQTPDSLKLKELELQNYLQDVSMGSDSKHLEAISEEDVVKASSKTTDDLKEGGSSSNNPDSSLMESSKAATAMTLQSSKCEELPLNESDMSDSSDGLGMESASWSSDDDLNRASESQNKGQLSSESDSDEPPDLN